MRNLTNNIGVRFFFLLFIVLSAKSGQAAKCSFSGEKPDYVVTFSPSDPNYLPGSLMRIGVTFKNASSRNIALSEDLVVLDSARVKVWKTAINLELSINQTITVPMMVPVPKTAGTFTLTRGSNTNDVGGIPSPAVEFHVLQPVKSTRLSKILVFAPDPEVGLNSFLKTWGIKAPLISWGQVLLLGKISWDSFTKGDHELATLLDRALKREMSVIFIDLGGNGRDSMTSPAKINLPFNVSVNIVKAALPEQKFVLKSDGKELNYNFKSNTIDKLNGGYGVAVPATDMHFEGKNVKINAFVTTGTNPFRFPVVEIIPTNGKGKVYLCEVLTDGRIDESVKPSRNHPELPAYDPIAVQFLLNLISASVGDNLLK